MKVLTSTKLFESVLVIRKTRKNKKKTMFTKSIVNYEKIIGYDFHIEKEYKELRL